MIPIPRPKITSGTPESQINEIKSYLIQLVDNLEYNIQQNEVNKAVVDKNGILHEG